jgi:hypothetical protein
MGFVFFSGKNSTPFDLPEQSMVVLAFFFAILHREPAVPTYQSVEFSKLGVVMKFISGFH